MCNRGYLRPASSPCDPSMSRASTWWCDRLAVRNNPRHRRHTEGNPSWLTNRNSCQPRSGLLPLDYQCCRNRSRGSRSEEHTSELQSQSNLVCRLLLEKKKKKHTNT